MKRFLYVLSVIGVMAGTPAAFLSAQEIHQDLVEVVDAVVVEIENEYERDIMGTDAKATVQEVRARILSGIMREKTVTFENDVAYVRVGDQIKLQRLVAIDGTEYYAFKDFKRLHQLIILSVVFVGVLLLVSGMKGVRALISLVISIGVIVYGLVPLLLLGYDPVWVSVGISSLMLAVAIFATHGFGSTARIAFIGTSLSIVATGILATIAVSGTKLTGFSSDAAIYLNFSTQGALDFSGLLLGGILIGVIGVLDDVAITQASVVAELAHANKALKGYDLYDRAIRVGRDHIGSLVNTLALAYAGVSLPLILLFARTDSTFLDIVNQEVVAAELVRTLVGSLGLMLTVPVTTLIAVVWAQKFGVSHMHDAGSHHHHSH